MVPTEMKININHLYSYMDKHLPLLRLSCMYHSALRWISLHLPVLSKIQQKCDYLKPSQPECQLSESKNSESILNFVSVLEREDGSMIRKTVKKVENDKVEAAIYEWFTQKRSAGQPISGLVLCEIALIFNQQLGWGGGVKS
jgi:hypothetical protein